MFLKREIGAIKLITVLATSTPMIVAREKAIENVEDGKNPETTAETSENSENLRLYLI